MKSGWGSNQVVAHVMMGAVHKPEGFHELVNVDAAILVEVDAVRKVHNGLVADVHLQMRAQQLPCLTELLERDQTCRESRWAILIVFHSCRRIMGLLCDS